MNPFVYDALPGRVVFGPGASREKLADEMDRLGADRVLLIATEHERPLAEDLAAPLGGRVGGVFTGVKPHVPVEVAQTASGMARDAGAEALLSIGGGSTTGTAKAIALESGLPIVAVPTTYAGSEMTPIWGMTEGQRKTTGVSRDVLPRVVVYDPELTYSLPAFITGPSAINAMAHCVEAFYAPGANPITSLISEEGIRALAAGTPAAVEYPEDPEARSLTLYGAYLAGASLAAAGAGLHHKICHVLGGAYDLPHADMHTVVLPHAFAFNEPAMPEIAGRIRRALGGGTGGSAAGGLYELNERIGAPKALGDLGMREEDLDEAVALCTEKAPAENPRPIDEAGVRGIIEGAFYGVRPAPVAERSV
jgi:alcohol dehydrogenase class IV